MWVLLMNTKTKEKEMIVEMIKKDAIYIGDTLNLLKCKALDKITDLDIKKQQMSKLMDAWYNGMCMTLAHFLIDSINFGNNCKEKDCMSLEFFNETIKLINEKIKEHGGEKNHER